jgi:hypothetical protein
VRNPINSFLRLLSNQTFIRLRHILMILALGSNVNCNPQAVETAAEQRAGLASALGDFKPRLLIIQSLSHRCILINSTLGSNVKCHHQAVETAAEQRARLTSALGGLERRHLIKKSLGYGVSQ